MKENIYDNEDFFERYRRFPRSAEGLDAAGEWHELKRMLPSFRDKRVLDLGCGFGWHCAYAAEQGAAAVVGVDLSEKMLAVAKKKTRLENVSYVLCAIEDYEYEKGRFDIVISSLALHYVPSFDDICAKVNRCLAPDGAFVFSVEHPILTSEGKQDWIRDAAGNALHWPVDRYFFEGKRDAAFLGQSVVKYHKTLTTYVKGLLANGFSIVDFCEPQPPEGLMQKIPDMKDELRRPMMLIISAKKTDSMDV